MPVGCVRSPLALYVRTERFLDPSVYTSPMGCADRRPSGVLVEQEIEPARAYEM